MAYPTRSSVALLLFAVLFTFQKAVGQEVDRAAVERIRVHGLEKSRVMEHVRWLADVYGPRLTGSPNLKDASDWAVDQLEDWGLENVHLAPWGPFGRGWSLQRFSLHVTDPVAFPVHAHPRAWSPDVVGPVDAEVVLLDADSIEALSAFEGTLSGKIVMASPPRTLGEPFEPEAVRRDADYLLERANAAKPGGNGREAPGEEALRRYRLRQAREHFLYRERPLAILDAGRNRGDYGSIYVGSAFVPAPPGTSWFERPHAWDPGADVIPQITVAAEHYNRIYRMVQDGSSVTATLDLRTTYHEDDPMAYNVIAELPGADPEIGDEVVMLGAHLDSWHGGTGATDNAAGSAVMMEAMRILQEVFRDMDVQPRRTIRLALWTGEEQGLLGSLAYVDEHYAELPTWTEPPTALRPDHDKLSAYYNLDHGTGKIRGVFLQGNDALQPIFRAWLAPFHDLGAATLSIEHTGSTDHVPFDRAGLPGFQFIQDPITYSRTHHSNMDVYDHVVEDDLRQAATIVAAFAYHTAQRDEKLPRAPVELAEPATTR